MKNIVERKLKSGFSYHNHIFAILHYDTDLFGSNFTKSFSPSLSPFVHNFSVSMEVFSFSFISIICYSVLYYI